jgi:hypothetical protein
MLVQVKNKRERSSPVRPPGEALGYMEATESLKYPYYLTRDICPIRANSEIFVLLHQTNAQRPQTWLASTQALRSRRMSSASKSAYCVLTHRSNRCSTSAPTGQTIQTHRSDRYGANAPPSLVLWSWLCGSTKEPSGLLVNHGKPRELGVAFANHHS